MQPEERDGRASGGAGGAAMNAPDGPATSRQRAQIGALGEHDAANDPDLTFSRASTLIDRLKGNGHPAPPPPRPTPVEKRTTTVAPSAAPADAKASDIPWVQVGIWLRIDTIDIVLEAVKEARGYVG